MQIRKIISVLLVNSLLVLVLYSYLYYSQSGEFPVFTDNWFRLIYLLFISNIVGFSIVAINNYLNKIPFWRNNIGLRFTIGLIVNYALILILIYFGVWFYLKIADLEFTLSSLLEEYNEIKQRVYILTLVLDILYVVFDFLIYSYKYYSHGQIQNARLKRRQMELQFEALKTQLSPHYLFNSLNTISSLVYKDARQTEEYIRKLANTYQYILDSDKKQLINLNEEIDFVNDYCYMLDIRFGKAFKVYIDVDKSFSEYLIPPLSIQILVENAVKHNVFDDELPLEVDIIAKDKTVCVKNRILRTPNSRESFKIGLGNVRKRYEVFTNKKIKIIKDVYFIVELPLLKSKLNG